MRPTSEHVVIVLDPFARRMARRGTLEDQLLRHERAPTTPLTQGPFGVKTTLVT
jgi:hypothetical protein